MIFPTNAAFMLKLNNSVGTVIDIVYNYKSLSYKENLNEVGSMSVTLNLSDLVPNIVLENIYSITLVPTGFNNQLVTAGVTYEFIVNDFYVTLDNVDIVFSCNAKTIELTWNITPGSYKYSQLTPTVLINAFLTAYGWTGTVSGTPPNNSAIDTIWQNESVWAACNLMRKWSGGWFRWTGGKTLLHGQFNFDISGVTPDFYFTSPNVDTLEKDFVLLDVTEKINNGQIVNRIIATGGGVYPMKNASGVKYAEGPLNLYYSNRTTPYTRTFNSPYPNNWYIEDTASQATYGLRIGKISYNEIKPISLSDTDMTNAANTLYDIASYYLKRTKNPQSVYEIKVTGKFVQQLAIGKCVSLKWYGSVNTSRGSIGIRNIDKKLYIVGIEWDYTSGEQFPVATLTVSSNGEDVQDLVDIISDLVVDTKKVNIRTQPSIVYKAIPMPQEPVGWDIQTGAVIDARHYFKVGAEVSTINEAFIDIYLHQLFTLTPLSYGYEWSAGFVVTGPNPPTAGGGIAPSIFYHGAPLTGSINDVNVYLEGTHLNPIAGSIGFISSSNYNQLIRVFGVGTTPLADWMMAYTSSWRTYQFYLRIAPNSRVLLTQPTINLRQTILPYMS